MSMTSLEDALLRLDEGIAWAGKHSGFNWWLRHRQEELGCGQYLVIPRPGSSRDFRIEPEPTLAIRLQELETVHQFELSEEALDRFGRLRLLTVPHQDGASPRWHPISLGHELAHIVYTKDVVHNWLSKAKTRTSAATEAKGVAKGDRSVAEVYAKSNLKWFGNLKSWLAETACDSVLAFYYGEEGIEALEFYLGAHSDVGDSASHPSPELRLAVLRAEGGSRLNGHRSKDSMQQLEKLQRNAYCDLAVELRDEIWKNLGESAVAPIADVRTSVRDSAIACLSNGLPPRSEDWDEDLVRESPSTIETGLVSAEWRRILDEGTALYAENQLPLRRLENRVDHAVNFLQFSYRFKQVAAREDVQVGPPKLTNVLHLSSKGVSPDAAGQMASAYDMRLGRHFIVFRRNQVPYLHALRGSDDSRRVQDLVEVGWGDDFVLHPGEMVLGVTLESVLMEGDCIAQVLSRSSLGRLGLLSATAVHVQPGFKGCLTLELVNLASVPLCLTPGQRIAQIVPLKARGAMQPYTGKYLDQDWRPKFSAIQEDPESLVLEGFHDE